MKPAFLITIDTEGDDLWSCPRKITTRNAQWLPRFHRVCEEAGLVPTYLTNYEMATSPMFQRFAHDVLRRGTAELGMHLHAWNSPPLVPLTADDFGRAPYLIEYPRHVMEEKIAFMTQLLRETFGVGVTSHRAGRWGFNGEYARILETFGYTVDCSVTPGVSWEAHPGGTGGGPDFTHAPRMPYYLDFDDVCRPGTSRLLEVPMTVITAPRSPADWLRGKVSPRSLAGRALNRIAPATTWLQPNGRNGARLRRLLDDAIERRDPYVEFTLHSSELMPGGSPRFPTAEAIDTLYRDIKALFAHARDRFDGMGLSAFASRRAATAVTAV